MTLQLLSTTHVVRHRLELSRPVERTVLDDDVMQAALIPVAYTLGTDFKPAAREPLETMVHWDGWTG